MNATQRFPAGRPTHSPRKNGALSRRPRYPCATSTPDRLFAAEWTARIMASDERPSWQDEARENPVKALMVALGIACLFVGVGSEYAFSLSRIGEATRWTLTLSAIGLVVLLTGLAAVGQVWQRWREKREQRGFEVKPRNKDA